jgi:hypothetical protein
MNQSGPDEISQGMDRRRFLVAGKLVSFGEGRRPRSRRRLALLAAGCAAVLVVATGAVAVVVSRPSYPHAWCGPVLTALHVRGESDLGYAAALLGLRHRDHAPVGSLVSDLRDYALARSVVEYDTDQTPSGSLAGIVSTFTAVQGDLRALNRRCGQPPRAYEDDSF